jgi:hypothetical protein
VRRKVVSVFVCKRYRFMRVVLIGVSNHALKSCQFRSKSVIRCKKVDLSSFPLRYVTPWKRITAKSASKMQMKISMQDASKKIAK